MKYGNKRGQFIPISVFREAIFREAVFRKVYFRFYRNTEIEK
jgi:hypothetical protein